MSEVEFKKFAICDTCGVETLCREDGEDDQCGGCYWAPINHAKHQAELSALREELVSANADKEAYGQNSVDLKKRLDSTKDALDKRNELFHAMIANAGRCRTCDGQGYVHGIDGELRGTCDDCDAYELMCTKQRLADAERRNAELEKLLVRCHRSDNISENCGLWKDLDAAINPTESGASE